MKTLSRLVVSLIVATMLMGVTACSSDDVARVNGEAITRAEFDAVFEMAKAQNPTAFTGSEDSTMIIEYKKSLLDTLIENELIRQAAAEEGADIAEEDIDAQIEAIMTSFPDEETFNTALAEASMTMDDLRSNVRDQLLYQYLYDKVAPDIEISDEDVAAYYEENKDLFVTGAESLLSHILFDLEDKATAEQVLAEIKAGGDFAALAEEYSIDPGSAADGGSLGWASTDTWVTEFKDAADALAVGEISELVESQFGWHIIMKVDETEGGQQPLEDVADSIRSTLLQEGRSSAFAAYMDDFMEKSEIEILDDTLKSEDE